MNNPNRYENCVFATIEIGEQRKPIRWMYREKPRFKEDSGWRLYSGEESQEFVDNPDNTKIYSMAVILEIDPMIEAYINAPVGSAFERDKDEVSFRKIKDFVLEK